IWTLDRRPLGTTGRGTHPSGRGNNDISAGTTPRGSHGLSLEQSGDSRTEMRALADVGNPIWPWVGPVTLAGRPWVCGDLTGGALTSANRADSFTLYTVGSNGKLRWQQKLTGIRKGHAYNRDHLVNILSQSADGTTTIVTGFDEVTGTKKFQL